MRWLKYQPTEDYDKSKWWERGKGGREGGNVGMREETTAGRTLKS